MARTTTDDPRSLDLPDPFKSLYDAEYPTGDVGDLEDQQDEDGEKQRNAARYCQYTRALWDEQELYYNALHQVWIQNLLFLSGRQWWTRGTDGEYRVPLVPSWKEMPVSNITLAFFRNYLAKALKNRPAWVVIPASTDPEDIEAAALGDDALEAKWQELRLSKTLRIATSWTIATGNGYLYPYWNSYTGKMVPFEAEIEVPVFDENGRAVGMEPRTVFLDEDGEPQLLPNGSPDPGAEPHFVDEGEVGVRVPSPFQVRVNPEAEVDEDLDWVIIAEARSIRQLARQYPDLVGQLIPEDIQATGLDRTVQSIGGLIGEPGTTRSPEDTRSRDLDRCLVMHYHEKPSEDYPDGRFWICTKDAMLTPPGPLPEGIWPPIIHMQDVVIPGRYHASSVLEQIVPLNKQYNELNAIIKEHHNLMAKGKWLVPKGSGIKVGTITNRPGEVIQFNPGFLPSQAKIESLPASVYEERNRILNDVELVGGLHRISMGKAPPGVTAGVAFLQLQEADDTDLGPFLDMMEGAVATLAGAILRIIKERYTTDRLLYLVGPNKKYQVRSFRGADLAGAVDVRAQAGSAFPWSKTAKQSMLITLASQMPALFQDPETGLFDQARFARMLPIGGTEAVGNDQDLDFHEARREEEMFSLLGTDEEQGTPQVEFWQDHDAHWRSHIRVLKSAKFLEWSNKAQMAFLQHVKLTQAERDRKATQMAQMQAMAQGNAPKELYQQGGPVGMGGQPTPGDLPPSGDASEEDIALAAEQGLDMLMEEGGVPPEFVAEMMASQPPPPAAGAREEMLPR